MFWFESRHLYMSVTNVLVTKPTCLARGHQPQVKATNTGLAFTKDSAIFLRSLLRQCYLAIGESGGLGALV